MTLSQTYLIINMLIGAVSFVFIARFMVQLVNANFHNSVSQLLIRVTKPILKPLGTVLPSTGAINLGCVVVLNILQLLAIVLFVSLEHQAPPTVFETISWMAVGLLGLLFQFFYIAVIAWALLSWLARGGRNPVYDLLSEILAPMIRPLDKSIPSMGGLSFSAIAFIFILSIIQSNLMPVLKYITKFYYGFL